MELNQLVHLELNIKLTLSIENIERNIVFNEVFYFSLSYIVFYLVSYPNDNCVQLPQ